MGNKKYSLHCCIVYLIGVIVFAYINFRFMISNPSIFNIVVVILHIPFVVVMIVCAEKAFRDYEKALQEKTNEDNNETK